MCIHFIQKQKNYNTICSEKEKKDAQKEREIESQRVNENHEFLLTNISSNLVQIIVPFNTGCRSLIVYVYMILNVTINIAHAEYKPTRTVTRTHTHICSLFRTGTWYRKKPVTLLLCVLLSYNSPLFSVGYYNRLRARMCVRSYDVCLCFTFTDLYLEYTIAASEMIFSFNQTFNEERIFVFVAVLLYMVWCVCVSVCVCVIDKFYVEIKRFVAQRKRLHTSIYFIHTF